jgi:hypothetical protein
MRPAAAAAPPASGGSQRLFRGSGLAAAAASLARGDRIEPRQEIAMLHELDERTADNLRVTLYWDDRNGLVSLSRRMDRLTALDSSFLSLENHSAHMHVAGVLAAA